MGQFAPPPGYVPVDPQQPQPEQPQPRTQAEGQAAAAAATTPGVTPKFTPPPGYVPVAQPETSQETQVEDSGIGKTLNMWKDEIVGPNTLLGNAGRDIAGIAHDVSQGNISHAVWGDAAPHIQTGSAIEKMIQKFNPSFRGAGTPETTAALKNNLTSIERAPLVNVSDQIDKNQHPMMKAFAEASQSFLTPENATIMIGSGGLGMIDSAAKLGVANKLLSAGFTAQAISDMYNRFPALKDAWNKGDAAEALYQATHMILSGAMAVPAGMHTAGKPMEVVSDADKAIARKVGNEAINAGGAVVEGAKTVANKVADLAGRTSETAPELVGKVTQATGEDIPTAQRALKTVDTSKVETYEDLRKVLDTKVKQNTAEVDKILSQDTKTYKPGDLEKTTPVQGGTPIVTNPVQDALDQLHQFYEKTKNVKGEAETAALQTKFETTGLTVKEVNDLAREHGGELNAYNANGELASGLSKQAAENTRQGVKEQVRQLAPKIQDIDTNTSDLITTRGLSEDMIQKVQTLENKIQKAGLLQKAGQAIGAGIDTVTGGFAKALLKQFIGQAGDAGRAGSATDIQDNLRKNLDKLDKLTNMTPQQAVATMQQPKIPVETAPQGWDKSPGRDFPEGFTPEDLAHHELGHVFVGHAEGFNPVEVISNKHPEVAGSRGTLARTNFSFDNLGVKPNGTVETAKIKENIDGVLRMFVAGAAANEVLGGIKPSENPGFHGDKVRIAAMLKDLGYTQSEAQAKVDAAYTAAKEHISQPHVSNAIRDAAKTRETGLPETHHFSQDRIQEIINGAENERNKTGHPEGVSQLGTTDESGGEGGSQGAARQKTAHPEAESTKSLRVPQERTTGMAHTDAAIKKGGAIPGGIQKGDVELDLPDLVLFHDPKTGSSLALPVGNVTPENIAKELTRSRKAFGVTDTPQVNAETAPKETPTIKSDPRYTTILAKDEEDKFQKWVHENKIPWHDEPSADYDMRGFWKSMVSGDPNAKRAANLHFPDTYKTPYHKTFSNQSKYADHDAPHWEGDRLIDKSGRIIADETPQRHKSGSAALAAGHVR